MKIIILLFVLGICVNYNAYALYGRITGPESVCPYTTQEYVLTGYVNAGVPTSSYVIQGFPELGIYRNLNETEGFASWYKQPNSTRTYITVQFEGPGEVTLSANIKGGVPFTTNMARATLQINLEYPPVIEPVVPNNYVCAGATKLISISQLESVECFHHNVQWGLPAGWSATPQSGNNYNLSVPGNARPGNYTISSRGVYDDRNNATTPWVHKTIRVGAPTSPIISAPSQIGDHWATVSANSIAGMHYSWSVVNGQILSGNGTASIRVQSSCNLSYRDMTVNLTVSNDCGQTVASPRYIQIVCDGYDPQIIISQRSDEIDVNLLEFNDGELKTSEVSLHDFDGAPVYQQQAAAEHIVIPTAAYRSGIYYINIASEDKKIQERIVIGN